MLILGPEISGFWFLTGWVQIYLVMKGLVQFFFWASAILNFLLDVTIYRETITQSYFSYNTTGNIMDQLSS